MHLAVGDTVHESLRRGPVAENLDKTKSTPKEIVTGLFVRTLSRRPTAEELADLTEMVAGAEKEGPAIYYDIFWSLLNSSEFLFNH